MRLEIMNVPFDNVNMDEALAAAQRILERGVPAYCVTPNSEIVYESMRDTRLHEILCRADLVLPDGAGVILASKILGTPLKQKVAGIEFVEQLMKMLENTDKRFYFLGGKPGVAEKAAEQILKRFPALHICGTSDGYFKEESMVVSRIVNAKPDVLLVCLGSPKQEEFMFRHLPELQVPLMMGLGGSLDIFAGNTTRAPRWMIQLNLEWLYRLIKEPSRFGRMLRLPKFLYRAMLRRLKGT